MNALIVGILCMVSGFSVGGTQILLGPTAINYPSARPLTRCFMFLVSGAYMVRAADLLAGCYQGHPQYIAASALPASFLLAAMFASILWNTLHQRLPAWFWARVERAVDIATCRPWWAGAMDRLFPTFNPDTFEGQRLANARLGGRPTPRASAADARAILGDAALRGINAAPPGESAADYIKRNSQ